MAFKTEQERFWAGEFGEEYLQRNAGAHLIASSMAFFADVLRCRARIDSVIEFGANIGVNLRALKHLLPHADLAAVEINETAAGELGRIGDIDVHVASMLEFEPAREWDLAFTRGVLIHIDPEKLERAYSRLYESSRRYICVAEYHNPTPVEIPYRGHRNKLFKRDFAGEMLEMFPDLSLLDYGFHYRRDPNFTFDDVAWFLMEKR